MIGYVHPFDEHVDRKSASLTNALPADVAHGKVDYYEVVGFSDHKASAEVWYRLLDLGFHLPAGAGTDAMGNYASLRGPVGMNRVFLNVAAPATPAQLKDALREGRTFATNSALLGFEAGERKPGDTLELSVATEVPYHASLRSIVPIDHFEVVYNGRVVATHALDAARTSADVDGMLNLDQSGWLVLRTWNEHADPRVQDIYPYATTSPVYIRLRGSVPNLPPTRNSSCAGSSGRSSQHRRARTTTARAKRRDARLPNRLVPSSRGCNESDHPCPALALCAARSGIAADKRVLSLDDIQRYRKRHAGTSPDGSGSLRSRARFAAA